MQNTEIFVAGKKILVSCAFHAMLDQEVLVKFPVDEDEFSFKLKVFNQKEGENSASINTRNGDLLEWEIIIYLQKRTISRSIKKPILFAQSEKRNLYYSMSVNRFAPDSLAYSATLIIYEEVL